MIDYFTSLGVEFSLFQSGTDPVKRGHTTGSGGILTKALSDDIASRGGRFLTSTRATHILLGESGKVEGISAVESGTNKEIRISATAVIVATGSASRNTELVARYNPEAANYGTPSGPWATGDGIEMIKEVRGQFWGYSPIVRLGAMVGLNGSSCQFGVEPLYCKNGQHSFIFVNQNSAREFDEQANGNGSAYLAYPKDYSVPQYAIFDQAEYDNPDFSCFQSNEHDALGSLVENGDLVKGETIEELAESLGIDSKALNATIASYNEGILSDSDEFSRDPQYSRAIEKAPYYGFKAVPSGKEVKLSVKVNEDLGVYDLEENVIPGLYAAGSKMINESVLGPSYPGSGAYCASGFVASKHAGRCACEYIAKQK